MGEKKRKQLEMGGLYLLTCVLIKVLIKSFTAFACLVICVLRLVCNQTLHLFACILIMVYFSINVGQISLKVY